MLKHISIITLGILVMLLGFGAARKATGLQDDKLAIVRLANYPVWMEIPIKVTEIRVKGQKVDLDWFFKADDNWLKDFSAVVQNVSDRPIVGVALNLDWGRDPADDQPYLPQTFLYAGQQFQEDKSGPGKKISLAPGESIEVSVSRSWANSHYSHRAGQAHVLHKELPPDIGRKATLYYEYAGFDQDYIWLHGNFARRDPGDPVRFVADPEKQKKVSEVLRLLPKPRIFKAGFAPGRSLPGCVRWDDSKAVVCTLLNCPGQPAGSCTVYKDETHDESPGFKRITFSVECRQLVGGELVPCGCCQAVQRIDYTQGCNT